MRPAVWFVIAMGSVVLSAAIDIAHKRTILSKLIHKIPPYVYRGQKPILLVIIKNIAGMIAAKPVILTVV